MDDSPVTISVDGKPWSPRNYDDRYEGPVSVRRALERSLNGATVRIAQATGLPAIVQTARAFGFDGQLSAVPAVALGALEVSPIELARAYAPFVNGGVRLGAIRGVRAVLQSDGTSIPAGSSKPSSAVMSPAEAYLMTSLLEGVMRSGTGASARALGVAGPVAGKTGTTNDGRDAWFVGYSSRLLVVVWVGFDDRETHGLSGAQAALPIWSDFMRQAMAAYPAPGFEVPSGIHFADVDATNGKLAGPACPLTVRETFLSGTEPEPCEEHRQWQERVLDWWQRLRGWFPK